MGDSADETPLKKRSDLEWQIFVIFAKDQGFLVIGSSLAYVKTCRKDLTLWTSKRETPVVAR